MVLVFWQMLWAVDGASLKPTCAEHCTYINGTHVLTALDMQTSAAALAAGVEAETKRLQQRLQNAVACPAGSAHHVAKQEGNVNQHSHLCLCMRACLDIDILMLCLPLQSCLKLLQLSTGCSLMLSMPWLQSRRHELLGPCLPTNA